MVRPRRLETNGDGAAGAETPEHQGATGEWSFDFQTRNRRPPRDPVNALLSLAYSLLAKDLTIAAYSVGFDPYVGSTISPGLDVQPSLLI
jgi:hypothetical protein